MSRRRWCCGSVLSLAVAAAGVLATVRSADADPLPVGAPQVTLLPLPTLPAPTPSVPLPLPYPTITTPPVTGSTQPGLPGSTATGPGAQPSGPAGASQAGATTPPPDGPRMLTPDAAVRIIADNAAADLYPQPPPLPADTAATALSDVEHRMQYLHNVLTRTAADLAAAQRGQGPVPQLIAALTGPASPPPPTTPAVDTPAGRVAALDAAVASGRTELTRREAEAQALQQQIAGWMRAAPVTATLAGWTGGKLLRPLAGPVTSPFGNRLDPYYHVWQLHAGIDLAAPPGTAIVAAAPGRVTQAGWSGGYGNYTCIEHGQVGGQRLSTCYGHQSRLLVAPGQQVAAGQVIGLVGSTGASTGPHLHFEVRLDGRPVDPVPWLGG
jgi:murein DD-endopeptidase MepM/ murein hydrolase activator NlpD